MTKASRALTVALLALPATSIPSPTNADIPVRQVLIESRIVVTTRDFARDLGITWSFLTPDQGLDLGPDDDVAIQLIGGFDVPFDKKMRASADVWIRSNNNQFIQVDNKTFKSGRGKNKNTFNTTLVRVDPTQFPLPLEIQTDIKLKGKQLEDFVAKGVTADEVIRLSLAVLIEPRKKK